MERKLASVQKIEWVRPIENADAIELVGVLGWQCVSKKGEFKSGDLCIYCEIDSVLPELPEFEFLRQKKFRIKTIKLRGQLSQGIVFPLNILSNKVDDPFVLNLLKTRERAIGLDVTDILKVKKYEIEIPAQLQGEVRGNFPGYLYKTDEIRIQSIPEILEEMKGINCYISVKMDGTSATFSNYNGDIHVCSRNLSKKESDKNIYWIIFKKYKLEEVLKELGNFAIQGEICAPGIQKNPIGLKEPELFIFSIFNIDKSLYLDYRDLLSVCNKYNLKTVPIEKENIVFDFNLDQLLEMAKGKYENTGKNREGIVIRPMIETYSKILKGRMSFKVINNDYLLKEED